MLEGHTINITFLSFSSLALVIILKRVLLQSHVPVFSILFVDVGIGLFGLEMLHLLDSLGDIASTNRIVQILCLGRQTSKYPLNPLYPSLIIKTDHNLRKNIWQKYSY